MKKLMMLAGMLAIVLAVSIPATAQVFPESSVELESPESGDVSLSGSVSSAGDNSSQCAPPTQFGNTGTPQDRLDFSQYASELDDIDAEVGSASILQFDSTLDDVEVDGGTPMTFEPSQEASCEQAVQQSAGAG